MKKIIKNKKGNIIATAPIILLFSILLIFILGTFYINAIKPFIWYEKLNNISNKYMFIIEKYGYLTSLEKINLEKDLIKSGFDINNINIIYPDTQKSYGEILEFSIRYKLHIGFSLLDNTVLENKLSNINLVVKKHSFSKYN